MKVLIPWQLFQKNACDQLFIAFFYLHACSTRRAFRMAFGTLEVFCTNKC